MVARRTRSVVGAQEQSADSCRAARAHDDEIQRSSASARPSTSTSGLPVTTPRIALRTPEGVLAEGVVEETLGLRLCVRVETTDAAGHVGRLREEWVVDGQHRQPRAKVRGDHCGVAERAARWLGKVDRTHIRPR